MLSSVTSSSPVVSPLSRKHLLCSSQKVFSLSGLRKAGDPSFRNSPRWHAHLRRELQQPEHVPSHLTFSFHPYLPVTLKRTDPQLSFTRAIVPSTSSGRLQSFHARGHSLRRLAPSRNQPPILFRELGFLPLRPPRLVESLSLSFYMILITFHIHEFFQSPSSASRQRRYPRSAHPVLPEAFVPAPRSESLGGGTLLRPVRLRFCPPPCPPPVRLSPRDLNGATVKRRPPPLPRLLMPHPPPPHGRSWIV